MTSGYQMVQFSDARYWHKIESENQPRSGFRKLTVFAKVEFNDDCVALRTDLNHVQEWSNKWKRIEIKTNAMYYNLEKKTSLVIKTFS
jgi:hypothetical protein